MNRFMKGLHAEGIWIPRDRALSLAKDGRHFIEAYTYLAYRSLSSSQTLYPLFPKLHMMLHVMEEMVHQSSRSQWVWNCLCDACYIEEDFVGRVSYLTRCVSARTQAYRALQRYLAQLNVCLSCR